MFSKNTKKILKDTYKRYPTKSLFAWRALGALQARQEEVPREDWPLLTEMLMRMAWNEAYQRGKQDLKKIYPKFFA